ncbi:MAG: 2-dehydro-3-deoxygalactonokinase [Rhodobacteraceae bacterium]|nr:2-dehydro-3-deoxygalactonokinase [Paracoccaceae bacterium]
MSAPDWIAVDWGTSHLRVWGLQGDRVLRQAASDQGMGQLAREGFEPALLALVADWLSDAQVTPVLVCGMAGSRQGWVEAPYRAIPCPPLGGALVQAPCRDLRLSVHVVPGLKQHRPADVIRGEETQIAGFLAQNPGWDGVLCLPGTHSKWVHVSAGEVVSFQTFLTGEMFALLSERSVLRHSVSGWDDTGFTEGVAQGMERPERLLARLFSIRAEGLLQARDPASGRARLSGLLIGAELAAAKPYWLGQRVAMIGAAPLAQHYAQALGTLSVPVTCHDATEMTLAGLAAARALLPQTERPCVN